VLIRTIVPRTHVHRALPKRRAAHSIFDDFWRDFGFATPVGDTRFVPRIDVSDSDAELRLSAELPGLEKSDFDVTVDGDVITIKGAKNIAREDGETPKRVARAERRGGEFSRSFRLPFEVDPDTISGSYRDGVLNVTVPKPAEPEPEVRTIPITTS
jgi:HSP20 family protein